MKRIIPEAKTALFQLYRDPWVLSVATKVVQGGFIFRISAVRSPECKETQENKPRGYVVSCFRHSACPFFQYTQALAPRTHPAGALRKPSNLKISTITRKLPVRLIVSISCAI